MKHLTKEELMEENYYTSEDKYWMKGGNTGTLPDRISPSKVNVLNHNELFVFEAISKCFWKVLIAIIQWPICSMPVEFAYELT